MSAYFSCNLVSKYFGSFAAINGVSFEVDTGEVFGIAGPNGAGKTTLFNCITGNPYRADKGTITFEGSEIQRLLGDEICRLGIARTFQIPEVFRTMTYLDNVIVGSTFGTGRASMMQLVTGARDSITKTEAMEMLESVGLREKAELPVKGASVFDLKRLMLASALATSPRLLLLDEPMGGLSRVEIDEYSALVRKLKEDNVAIILIEHIMPVLMSLSDRIMLLSNGAKVCEGKPEEIATSTVFAETYLGRALEEKGME